MRRLEAEDQEKTLIFNETSRIAKENAQEIRSWEQLYAEAIASHKDVVEKLDARLAGK